ncbi:PRC-barrel domain containing protein [Pseudohoeflea suaedae]|uniref:PRC-barrel domain containing protein n=1 Tax=Pseudohoeflea suaedae TaxID=877384 RepID=A0A4R5PMU5_9HYPH|nr:PRC-barrel domain-containing protein [Pseudohoeflea suaedae]TDH38340.1 PRC-barrel domain containing protein [Pseudohoeflea suaedae]
MIRTLLTTTAMVAILQTGAFAQSEDTTAPAADPAMQTEGTAATGAQVDANAGAEVEGTEQTAEALPSDSIYDTAEVGDVLANRLIGTSVYNGTGEEAEAIGDINDIILSKDGQVEAVVIGVGGFLGIGEKNVAVQYDKVEVTGEKGEERFVLDASKESLENAPAFDIAAMTTPENTGTDTAMTAPADGSGMATDTTGMAAAPADPAAAPAEETAQAPAEETAAPAEEMAEAPADTTANEEQAMADDTSSDEMTTGAITTDSATAGAEEKLAVDRDSMQTVDAGTMSADELDGATVYNSDNESIGEIGDIILGDNEKIEAFIVDVGGFLGIGEKEVAVNASDLDFRKDESGNIVVFTPFTQDQLEQQAAYDEDSYKNDKEAGSLKATKS